MTPEEIKKQKYESYKKQRPLYRKKLKKSSLV